MLCVSNKVKHFAWRACSNALLSMVNLLCCQVVTTDQCSNCKSQPEDVVHAVWSCKEVESVWSNLSWLISRTPSIQVTSLTLFQVFCRFRRPTKPRFSCSQLQVTCSRTSSILKLPRLFQIRFPSRINVAYLTILSSKQISTVLFSIVLEILNELYCISFHDTIYMSAFIQEAYECSTSKSVVQ